MTPRWLRALLSLSIPLVAASHAWAAAPIPPSISITSVQVSEGSGALTPFEVSVVYQYGFSASVEADIAAVPGTATADDFQFTPVHLTLTPNVPQRVKGFIVGDRVREPSEAFTIQAKSPSTSYNLSGAVTIVDDDFVKPPTLSIDSLSAPEGNDSWHDILVPVRLDPPSPDTVTVTFGTASGDPNVFRGTMGVLTFAPGETTKTIPLSVRGNTYWERDKTGTISLMNARAAELGASQGTVTLTNDDAPTIITVDDATVVEGLAGTTTALVHLRFAPPAPPQSKVWFITKTGTALDGSDFKGISQTLYPQGGETEMTIPIEVFGDAFPECDEALSIQAQGVYFGDDAVKTAHLIIRDDDEPKPAGCGDPLSPQTVPIDVPRPDPPQPDAGPSPSGSADAGSPTSTPAPTQPDAARPSDATATFPARAGCDCAAGPSGSGPGLPLLLGAWLVTLARRRRR
jgi:MYXO-CTERM domain-containing protein